MWGEPLGFKRPKYEPGKAQNLLEIKMCKGLHKKSKIDSGYQDTIRKRKGKDIVKVLRIL